MNYVTADMKIEGCQCEYHCTIHPVSGAYPLCQHTDNPELIVNSQGQTSYWALKPPEPDREVLMTDGEFFIEKTPDNSGNLHNSSIMHYCPRRYWNIYINEAFMLDEGICIDCMKVVPPGLIALWKMHNWQYIQKGIDPDPNEPMQTPLGL